MRGTISCAFLVVLAACTRDAPPPRPSEPAPITTLPTPCALGDPACAACLHGDGERCFTVGFEHEKKNEPDQAASLFGLGCDAGHANACKWLAEFARRGSGVPRDRARARRLDARAEEIERATVARHLTACEALTHGPDAADCDAAGHAFLDGKLVARDVAKANSLFDRACGFGDGDGCLAVGSDDPFARSIPERIALMKRGCLAGAAVACAVLPAELASFARPQLERLCDAADPPNRAKACAALGSMLANGRGTRRDPQKAATALAKACDLGEASSCEEATRLARREPMPKPTMPNPGPMFDALRKELRRSNGE